MPYISQAITLIKEWGEIILYLVLFIVMMYLTGKIFKQLNKMIDDE